MDKLSKLPFDMDTLLLFLDIEHQTLKTSSLYCYI